MSQFNTENDAINSLYISSQQVIMKTPLNFNERVCCSTDNEILNRRNEFDA